MAFDETLAARIRTAVARKKGIEEKFPEDVQAILENGPQSATLLPTRMNDQLHDACFQAARNSGLFRWMEERIVKLRVKQDSMAGPGTRG